ncbi:hypothetical protein ACFQ0M_17365 [Kitasatospora aburaviensis]
MPEAAPPTRAQLHEQACIHCGRADAELVPAGHHPMQTQHGHAPLGWAVVACAPCRSTEDPEETA